MLITAPHLVELSSAADDDASLGAAGAVLSAADPGAELDRLYPALLHHKTLLAAISHLERAGGDLKELSVSSALYRSLWPMNVLMPIPDPSEPGRVSLASIRELLDRHRLLLRGVVRDLVDLGPSFRFLLIFGRSLEAAYPAYKLRMDYDTDLFAPDLAAGLDLLRELLGRMGYALSRCKVSRVDGPGLAVLNTFRGSEEGHELHLDVMVGGYLARAGLRPLWFQAPMWERSRDVDWQGSPLRVPSIEDMVLITAVKAYRRQEITRRDCNDTRFLVTAELDRIDWDYLARMARAHQVNGAVHLLLSEAERMSGRPLAPQAAMRELAPGPLERRLLVRAASEESLYGVVQTAEGPVMRPRRRRWSSLWPALWMFRYVRRRLGSLRAFVYMLAIRTQRALFRQQLLGARRGKGIRHAILPMNRALRPRFGSLCELRETSPPLELGFCLSRTDARRPRPPRSLDEEGVLTLQRLIEALPNTVVEEKIATTEKADERLEKHRCGAFLFNLGRVHRPVQR